MKKINKTFRWIKRIASTALVVAMFVAIQGATPSPHGRDVLLIPDQAHPALAWGGISNATYRVEQRTNLLTGAWKASPPFNPKFPQLDIDGRVTWPITEPDLPAQFFRVLFPTPELTGSEPAFVPQAGGTTVYVTGNYFYEGDQIRVDGVLLANVVFLGHNLLSGELPDLAPGLHDVDVLNGHSGGVLKALPDALQVSPPLERMLQGSPEWPLAGPASPRSVVAPRDPPSGQATGKRMHAPRSQIIGSGQATGKRMHSPLRSSGNGGHWGDPHENVSKRISSDILDDDSDNDGLDPDSDDDGVLDVRLYSGEVRQQTVDMVVPGRGLDFVWGRTYRSRTGTASSQGNRWSHSYDVRCVQNSDGDMEIFDGSGRKDIFRGQADGTYACPEIFREGTLDVATGTFRLTFADTGYWEFKPLDASPDASPDAGKLACIVDRNGNTMTLTYDVVGRLAEIVDDLGRTHTVAYTSDGQVASVTDSSDRTITYAYYGEDDPDGCPGDLKSATSPIVTGTSITNDFPTGKTTTYTYTTNDAPGAGSLLLSIVDPLDQITVQCDYDLNPASATFARCLSMQSGTNSPTCLTYVPQTPAPGNRFAAMRCIVNDPEGNVSEHDFDLRNRCLSVTEFTGRATPNQWVTATANRPTNPLRPDDPASFKITWTWNDGGLCTSQTLPSGDRDEWVYQSDLAATTSPRFRANLRTERCISAGDLDGDGDRDAVISRFEHDPRFGTSETTLISLHTDSDWTGFSTPGFKVSQRAARTGRNPQTGKEIKIAAKKVAKFKAGKALADTVKSFAPDGIGAGDSCPGKDNDCSGFVTRIINPRGFETTLEYDANGNQTALTRHGSGGSSDAPPVLAREDFAYNPYGQLTAITNAPDANGYRRVDICSYYASGPQAGYLHQTVVDAGAVGHNLTSSFQYDARGNVTNTVDPRGTATSIELNALDQTVAVATQGASTSERAALRCYYDAANNLVRSEIENRDGDGTLNPTNAWFATVYDYDALHQLTRLVEADGLADGSLTNTFAYNGNGQLVLARSPLAVQGADPFHVTGYAYDERGLLFRETCAHGSPLQATTGYDYDANGRLRATRAGIEDADGLRVTAYTYDGFGRCASVTDPMGNETRFEYDLNDNLVCRSVYGETNDVFGSVSNIRLSETRYGYDVFDRVVWYSDAFFDVFTELSIGDGWRSTAIAYAPNGLVIATTNDRGSVTTFAYDTAHRLTEVIDAKTNRVEYTYDANGNLLSATETGRNDLGGPNELLTRTFSYDALDRCVADWDNVGNTNRYAYDSRGNRVRHTDELGFNLEGDFDSVSRPTSNRKGVGGSAQNTTRCVWDAASRLVTEIDANTNTTAYTYDSLNRLVRTTLADGTSQTNAYDVHGNLVWTRDANGTEISMTYDALDRCVLKNITPGEGVASDTTTESCQYDGLSRLVLAANDHTTVTREYDSLGRCVHEATRSSAFGFNPQEITATRRVFDAHGLMLSQTLPSGRVVECEYDEIDRPVWMGWAASVVDDPVPLAAFAYAGPERLARVTRANGTQTDYTYSGLVGVDNPADDYGWGEVRCISHTLGGTTPIDEREFAYDRKQNKTLRAQVDPYVSGGPTNRQAFTYDSLDRLVSSVTTTNGVDVRYRDYTFDAAGNRTYLKLARNASPEAYTSDSTLPDPGDFQVNQYTTTPLDARRYDADGNLVQTVSGDPATPVTTSFVYDYADRLVAVTNAAGPRAVYAYDALGRRIAKVLYDVATGTPVLTNRYLYADGQVVEEEDGDGTTLRSYAIPHVFDRKGQPSNTPYTFDTTMFAMIDGNGVVLYTHNDDQGSLLAITDAKGDVVGRFDYGDYGAPSFLDADGKPVPALDGNPYLFHGMEWDAETGLYWDGGDNPSTQMNKGELIDAIAKDAGFSPCRYYDPNIGRGLSHPYGGNNPYSHSQGSLKGPVPPYCPTVGWPMKGPVPPFAPPYPPGALLSGPLPGGAIISAAVSSLVRADDGGPVGGGRAQDHNSSRSNKTASIFSPDGGGGGMDNFSEAVKKVAKFKAGKALADVVK